MGCAFEEPMDTVESPSITPVRLNHSHHPLKGGVALILKL
jgi:hypothetical protein